MSNQRKDTRETLKVQTMEVEKDSNPKTNLGQLHTYSSALSSSSKLIKRPTTSSITTTKQIAMEEEVVNMECIPRLPEHLRVAQGNLSQDFDVFGVNKENQFYVYKCHGDPNNFKEGKVSMVVPGSFKLLGEPNDYLVLDRFERKDLISQSSKNPRKPFTVYVDKNTGLFIENTFRWL